MDEKAIIEAKNLILKPNGLFADVNYPFLYQKRGGLMMLLRPRMVNGDDVGLGKTLESILCATYLKKQKEETKFLVMTEKTALVQWAKEIEKLTLGLKSRLITAELQPDPKQRIKVMRNPEADFVITSYSMLYHYHKYLVEGMGQRWIAIFDEPEPFKNTEAKAHTIAYDMVNGPNGPVRAYGLTATIVGNRLEEAFGVLRIIAPGTIPSRLYFDREFCVTQTVRMKASKGEKKKKIRVVTGYKNLKAFRELIKPVFFGRSQNDPEVEQDLPEVRLKDVEIYLGVEQSKKVLEASDRLFTHASGETKQLQLLPALGLEQLMVDDPRVKGFQIAGAKTKAWQETIIGSLVGERVVTYSKFRMVIDFLEQEIRKVTTRPILRITGKETWEEKERNKDLFMSDGGEEAILLMTNAGRRAINLQRGGHLFFFDLPWSYDAYRQLIGRLKRTGSSYKHIGVYRFLALLHPDVAAFAGGAKTIDHHILTVLLKKYELFKGVTGHEEDIDTVDVGGQDLKEIFDEIKKYRKK